MLTVFCLRLSCGMVAALMLLSPRVTPARFFRNQFLIAFGLTCLATVAMVFMEPSGLRLARGLVSVADVLAFAGSAVWALQGARGGRTLIVLTAAVLAATLGAIA